MSSGARIGRQPLALVNQLIHHAAAHSALRESATLRGRGPTGGQIARPGGVRGGRTEKLIELGAIARWTARLLLSAHEQFELRRALPTAIFIQRHAVSPVADLRLLYFYRLLLPCKERDRSIH